MYMDYFLKGLDGIEGITDYVNLQIKFYMY